MGTSHSFRFFRAGGFDQLRLEESDEILAVGELDKKLWVALACPVRGLELDPKTLAMIDTDHDGRIRPPEVLAAVEFAGRVLKKPGDLKKRASALPLSAIDDEDDEGKRLLASAKQILQNLGKKDKKEITFDDVLDTTKIFAQTKFNGDGVVPADSADDAAARAVIEDVIAKIGLVEDRSGKPGITKKELDAFFEQAAALDAWWKKSDDAGVLALSEKTAAAADALDAVRAKVEDFFVRCRLAAFDARAAAPLNRAEQDYANLAGERLAATDARIAEFPLARVEANRSLPLDAGVNPAWAASVKKLAQDAVTPLVGARAAISESDWIAMTERLAPYFAWRATRPESAIESLGRERIATILGGDVRAKIEALLAKDLALAPEAESIASVERLLRYYRDLHALLCNFVSFRDFYAKGGAIFQAGTLYVDGRSCDLCIRIDDVGAHSAIAALSYMFLLYCECKRKDADGVEHKMTIAAAVTAGHTGQIRAGRNGIFVDRKGDDWDATLVKVIENPISIRQAFWSPYIRLARFVGEQIEKFATARDDEAKEITHGSVKVAADEANKNATLKAPPPDAAAPAAAAAAAAAPAAPIAGFDVAKFAGIFAAIGLAIGAIGSSLVAVMSGFVSLKWWQMPLACAGIMLVISGPAMIIAWLKLRKRNLGPLLDGAGWAVNAEARINIPFGASLTSVAELPKNAERSTSDPYAEKSNVSIYLVAFLIFAALTAAVKLGFLHPWIRDIPILEHFEQKK
jgi:hypothetical protein